VISNAGSQITRVEERKRTMSIIDKLPRAARLFNSKDRRLLNVAVDHGVFNEVRNDNHDGSRSALEEGATRETSLHRSTSSHSHFALTHVWHLYLPAPISIVLPLFAFILSSRKIETRQWKHVCVYSCRNILTRGGLSRAQDRFLKGIEDMPQVMRVLIKAKPDVIQVTLGQAR